jgi:hypothetical protein
LRRDARPTLAEIGRLIDDGKVRVVISATFPLARVREAEELLEQGHVRGQVVVTLVARGGGSARAAGALLCARRPRHRRRFERRTALQNE